MSDDAELLPGYITASLTCNTFLAEPYCSTQYVSDDAELLSGYITASLTHNMFLPVPYCSTQYVSDDAELLPGYITASLTRNMFLPGPHCSAHDQPGQGGRNVGDAAELSPGCVLDDSHGEDL